MEPYDGSDPARCNMPRRGKFCRNGAGKGTDHLGFGFCAKHGGQAGSGRKHGMKLKANAALAAYGLPRAVDPHRALLEEVHRTAGHVEFLGGQVAKLTAESLVWGVTKEERSAVEIAPEGAPLARPRDALGQLQPGLDEAGEKNSPAISPRSDVKRVEAADVSIWVKLYQAERTHLVKVCATAIACGIEERRVQIAEDQGKLLVGVIVAVLADLGLNPNDPATREVVHRRLLAASISQNEGGM